MTASQSTSGEAACSGPEPFKRFRQNNHDIRLFGERVAHVNENEPPTVPCDVGGTGKGWLDAGEGTTTVDGGVEN